MVEKTRMVVSFQPLVRKTAKWLKRHVKANLKDIGLKRGKGMKKAPGVET